MCRVTCPMSRNPSVAPDVDYHVTIVTNDLQNALSDTRSAAERYVFRALNAVVIPALDAGIGNPLPLGVGPVVVDTVGRVSGKKRRVPLLSVRVGDSIYVSTVRSSSNWFANLEATPTADVRLHGTDRTVTATVQRGPLNVAVLKSDPRSGC